jgi:hypothetical protein
LDPLNPSSVSNTVVNTFTKMADVQSPAASLPPTNSIEEQKPAAATSENELKQDDTKEEEYKMPDNASETLYLQNLNETVRVDCRYCPLSPSRCLHH